MREREHLVADPILVEAFLGVPRHRDLRVVERGYRRHRDPVTVAERAQTSPRPPTCMQCRSGHDTDDELTGVLEADERGPDRNAAHVALRAVDGIDDPTEFG